MTTTPKSGTDGKLWFITMTHAAFGIIAVNGVIVKTPPIAHWAIGKQFAYFKNWVVSKGGTVEPVIYTPVSEGGSSE